MDLLSKLIAAGRALPPTHIVGLNDLVPVVSALIAHVDHGPQFLQVAEQGDEAVRSFLDAVAAQQNAQHEAQGQPTAPAQVDTSSVAGATPSPVAPPPPAQPVPAGVPIQSDPVQPAAPAGQLSDAELVAQIESLQVQLANRQKATVTTTPAP